MELAAARCFVCYRRRARRGTRIRNRELACPAAVKFERFRKPMTSDLLSLRAMIVSRQAAFAVCSGRRRRRRDAARNRRSGRCNCGLQFSRGLASISSISTVICRRRKSPRSLRRGRAAGRPPFTILLGSPKTAGKVFETDGLAVKPSGTEAVRALIDRSMRVRLPSRVLVVDDSSTMRTIVQEGPRGDAFPFDVSEAGEGLAALKMVREDDIHIVFLDYNMPGFSGLETLAEFKREKRRVSVVLIRRRQDETVAERARADRRGLSEKAVFSRPISRSTCCRLLRIARAQSKAR